ncbi:MAG TPA: response regulator, partial [Blastocatellia bacterium]|nr:response regulator [Blastocatellia bacterium]
MRVLVVDDVEINRKLLSATLEAEGVEIVLAEDGQEALSVLETEGVDAIISDILMPNVDGYRLCYEIRKNDALKNIPFIVYSESYTSPSDEKLAAQFGADRFLKKSASTREILTALNEVTNGGRFRVSSSGPPLPDLDVMKEYSERLVSMLKEKNTELERAKQMLVSTNRELLKRTFELKESEERYREIFENSAEGIIQSLPSGRILTANPAAARILGYESPRHLIENLRGIQDHYADPQRGLDSTRPANWDEAMEPSELELNRIDGKRIWVLARGRQVRDADGAVICYESTIEDITGRKHLEDQLRQSQKMEAIGRLAGGVAHDFNNLLTAIIGYAQLASGRVDCPDPVNKDIQEIEKAGRRAAALTNQLLIFSRRQVIQAKVMDLNSVVTDAENMLTRLIGEDIELVTSLDPAVRPIKADPTQVEQIILNLAINARDAMPDGGKLIIETQNVVLDESYLSQHMEAARGAYVMLAVSDTGHG